MGLKLLGGRMSYLTNLQEKVQRLYCYGMVLKRIPEDSFISSQAPTGSGLNVCSIANISHNL